MTFDRKKYLQGLTPKERYRAFLHADTGFSFSDYLGINKPDVERESGRYRFKTLKVKGEWKGTKGEARKAYKEQLNRENKERRCFLYGDF